MKRTFLTFICASFLLLISAYNAGAQDKRRIITTTGMITDLVSNIAEGRAEVRGLIGSGVDPHLYKPTRSDIALLSNADIVFYNGLLLEGKMTDALIRAATAGKKVHAVTELIDTEDLLEPSEFQGLYDPHVWMDPRSWALGVPAVKEKLIQFDPEGTDAYETNARAYSEKLEHLDRYAEELLRTVPEDKRVLVTAHDAFNYFGRRYGFEVLGIQGLSTESEAGVQDVERIVDVLVKRKIGAVFVESTVSRRNVEALIEGARAKGHVVKIGGELFSDAMGAPGTYEGTYIGMIDHNVTHIAKALGGKAKSGGMQGMLSSKNDAE